MVVVVAVGGVDELLRPIGGWRLRGNTRWVRDSELAIQVLQLDLRGTRAPARRLELNGGGLCACDCGGVVQPGRHFLSGHDQRALHDRVKRYFNGSTLQAIRSLDAVYGAGQG